MSGLANRKGVSYFTLDVAKHGGAVGDIDVYGDGIPKGAVIDKVMVKAKKGVTSGGAATLACTALTAADLLAATAIADLELNERVDGAPDGSAANSINLTAAINKVTFTVAVADITAGKVTLAVEWYHYGT